MIKSVIFDMDGLLIDSEKVYYSLFQKVLTKYEKEISLDDYVRDFSGSAFSENIKKLIDKFSLPADKNEIFKYFNAEGQRLTADDFDLKPGAESLLEFLKDNHYTISLATSNNQQIADGILQGNGIFDYFEFRTYGNEVNNGKPDPEIFLTAFDKTNVEKDHTIILEDSENGITAANEAGIKVIGIPDMKKPSQKHKKMTYKMMNSLNEFKNYLLNPSKNE